MRRLVLLALGGAAAAVTGLLSCVQEPLCRPRAVRGLPLELPVATRPGRAAIAHALEVTARPRHAVTEAPRAGPAPAPPRALPGHTVVRVLDPQGCPVADAAIETYGKGTFRTDRGGWARIPPLPGDMGSPRMSRVRTTITVRAPGYAPVHEGLGSLPPWIERDRIHVRLKEHGVKLAAQFVDPRGEPVAGLRVAVNRTLYTCDFKLVTDAEGRIATDHAPPRACTFTLASDTWLAREKHLLPGRQRLIVHRFARMRGHIRPATGEVRVELCTGRRVWVNSSGEFELACIPGRVTLLCRDLGLVLGTFHLEPGERRDGVEIVLPAPEPATSPS